MTRRRSSEIWFLLRQLEEGYEKKAWHGPNLKGSLRGLTPEEAAWRPGPGRHNIWEIAVHCAYWKYAVWRQLSGGKRGTFPLRGSNWFRRPLVMRPEALREDLRMLELMHLQLRGAVAELPAPALGRRPRGSKHTAGVLIAGAASHDIYHAGQIQLIKRLMER
jgi:hypothetical protein